MRHDNKSDNTINFTRKAPAYLDRHANLNDPEAVKAVIANLTSSDSARIRLDPRI